MAASNIVITGAAVISPLGADREKTFEAILAGRCGMGKLRALEQELPDGRDGGEAVELPGGDEDLPREVRYLKKTVADALADAGLAEGLGYAAERCGLLVGTTLHGMRAAGRFLRNGDFRELGKFLACHVNQRATEEVGIGGFSATTCSACSSSLGSIALGVTMLESGAFDLVIAGGYDPVSEYAYAGFNALRLVSEGPLRPFSRGRTGMKLSEGYGIVILERAPEAQKRGGGVMARIAGIGESADAHHLTQPHPRGEGAAGAMRKAIESAQLRPEQIDLLIAHATGTPDNDASEYAAMKSVFGEHLRNIPCVAMKSHLGHTLGGAGAVELILGAMAMERQMVPPCANVKREDVEYPDLNLSIEAARPAKIKAMLSTSLGFGGANTCVVLRAADSVEVPAVIASKKDQEAVITGVGVVVPGAIGNQAFLSLLQSEKAGLAGVANTICEEQFAHLVNARRTRRLSEYVKLMLAATSLAMADAQVTDIPEFAAECAAILGTTHGSCSYSEQYYRQIVQEGVLLGNPMLFAEGVPNAASAHVSLMLGVKGGCQTIIGSRSAGLDALALASWRIRSGAWERAIVGAAEEWSALTAQAYATCGLGRSAPGAMPFEGADGFVSSAASVVLILESREAAARRGVRIRGVMGEAAARVAGKDRTALAVEAVMKALGNPAAVISSANATWVDQSELAGIKAACNGGGPAAISSVYGHIAETFSAGPLAGLAAVLLGGRLPRLQSEAGARHVSERKLDSVGVLCTDFTGAVSGVRVQMAGDGQ